MKKAFAGIGLMIALTTVSSAQDSGKVRRPELPTELKESFERAKNIRFSGTRTVTVVRAGKIETHNEYVTKDGPNLRIEFATGSPYSGQIIIETNKERKHYFPDKNEIREYPSFSKKQFEGFRSFGRGGKSGSMHFDTSTGGVIAGQKCTKFQLSDSSNNPVAQVYIEPRSGMTMKRVIFDQTGNIAGSYEFVTLTLDPKIQPGAFKIFRKGATVIRPSDDLRKVAKELGLPALALPKSSGYLLEGAYVRDVKGAKVLVQSYGSDDSRITVFMTKSTLNASDLRRSNRGELVSSLRTLNGVTIVLMGDQTEDRLRTLSNQLSE
ncbi:MAG: hypothetical protein WCG75_06915 [Armatimonadota bacterium]